MKIVLLGDYRGAAQELEIILSDPSHIRVIIKWREPDGEEIHSRSILVNRDELKKAAELL